MPKSYKVESSASLLLLQPVDYNLGLWHVCGHYKLRLARKIGTVLKCLVRHALYFQETAREDRNKDALGWSGQRGEGDQHV